uniref:Uncharacterized protein n=1 Tax=Arundo donax TaxID=35708 RepID=A0A0A9CGQ5_ARUDO
MTARRGFAFPATAMYTAMRRAAPS